MDLDVDKVTWVSLAWDRIGVEWTLEIDFNAIFDE